MSMNQVVTQNVTFSGSATSTSASSQGGVLVGAFIPASMAGTTLTVYGALDAVSAQVPVTDSSGASYAATIGATARYVIFPQSVMPFGIDTVSLVSSTSETSKTVTLVFQKVA